MSNTDEVPLPIAGWHEPLGATDPRDISLPLYGATPGQAMLRLFLGYVRFSGRVSRSEYWWPAVGLSLIGVVAAVFNDNGPGPLLMFSAVLLVCALPSLALVVRRLHDANLSGWWCLLGVLPYLGAIIQIVIGLLRANPEVARFERHDPHRSGSSSF